MNKRELFNSFVKSYAALVEDMENTIDCLGKKQVLTDLIKGAKRSELWDIWYWLSEVGYYTEDKRKIRDFALNVVNNCYIDYPSSVYEERINREIENAIFNALHKDKEEYFQGLDEALELHDVLNPVLWENEALRSDVASALLKIANTFVDGLGFPLNVVDIRIVGSNASYNYNKDSDIDLHIITNFELNYVDDIILQQLYNNEKNSFNNKHDIKVKGIPVELYVEDIRSMNATNGSYSLLDNDWIKFPQPMNYTIPDYSVELEEELDRAEEALLSDSSQKIKEEINHVYLMRRDGLASEGEVSKGNLVFKELRNMGILKTLAERFYELESIELSLESEDLTEYHDYLNLTPQVGFDDSDSDSVNYWKEQIKKGNHRPILINTDKEILDGNHTMKAYQDLGIEPPYVYLGTREDFYKHVANTKPIDALVAVKDMVADGSAELLEKDLKSYPISSDVVKNILDDLFTNFGWHSIYGDNKKKLVVLSKNNKKVGTVNISNHKRQVHFHILGGSITVDIPDSYDNNDSEYDYMIRSFDRTLSSLIKDTRSEKKSSEEKDDIDFGFTGHQEDEDGNVYSYQNGVKGEVALDDYFDESQVISEDDLGYHYGDLGKGRDTYRFNMEGTNRSTGHLGTGTYFLSKPNDDPNFSRADREVKTVDFSKYNLYKPDSLSDIDSLFEFLKNINNYTFDKKDSVDFLKEISYELEDTNSDSSDFHNVLTSVYNKLIDYGFSVDDQKSYTFHNYDYMNADPSDDGWYHQYLTKWVDEALETNEDAWDRFRAAKVNLLSYSQISESMYETGMKVVLDNVDKTTEDSLSTIFMKALGYEGVDVREIPQYDNTEHGSVIYDLKESIKGNTLNEADLLDILNKARSETPKRVRRSQSLYSEYTGLDSDGTIMFHTDSQTRAGHNGHDQFIFYEGFFDLLDKVDAGEHISQEDVLDIITGDVMIRCTCEDFLYGGFAYMSWNNGYGLQKELRAPDVRNPNREGSACKHCLSVLNLINQSNTLFDTIAKDLDALFQRYKKMAKGKAKNESQILTEISDLHGDLDPYDLADDLFRLTADIEVLYDKYDKDNSGVKDKDSIIASLDNIRDFVVNKFGMMGDTTNMVTEAVGDVTPDGVMDTLDSIYKEIDDLYDQEKDVVDNTTKDEHLKAIKKIQAFFTKKFNESKKS